MPLGITHFAAENLLRPKNFNLDGLSKRNRRFWAKGKVLYNACVYLHSLEKQEGKWSSVGGTKGENNSFLISCWNFLEQESVVCSVRVNLNLVSKTGFFSEIKIH